METVLISLAIFVARLADQSIGTMRIIFLMRGRPAISGLLDFFESAIWLLAVSQVVTNIDQPIKVIAFSGGFGAGTALGGPWSGGWLSAKGYCEWWRPSIRRRHRSPSARQGSR